MPDTPVPETIVWISGATQGIGAALARNVPYADARIVNLSRGKNPDTENFPLDLDDRASWAAVASHFATELAAFRGRRAIFIQNAVSTRGVGLIDRVDAQDYADALVANAVAPIVLGAAFLRAARPGVETGLAMMSAGGAAAPFPGHSGYCAAKAGIEHWVRVARQEYAGQANAPWIVAVRPGFVDTPLSRKVAALDAGLYPAAGAMRQRIEAGAALPADTVARQIWSAVPPDPTTMLLSCGRPNGVARYSDDGTEQAAAAA